AGILADEPRAVAGVEEGALQPAPAPGVAAVLAQPEGASEARVGGAAGVVARRPPRLPLAGAAPAGGAPLPLPIAVEAAPAEEHPQPTRDESQPGDRTHLHLTGIDYLCQRRVARATSRAAPRLAPGADAAVGAERPGVEEHLLQPLLAVQDGEERVGRVLPG